MKRAFSVSLIFIFTLILCGCAAPGPAVPTADSVQPAGPDPKAADLSLRDNALALLNDLLGQEKDVGKVLYIKKASPELKRVIKEIATASAAGVKTLQLIESQTPDVLNEINLPSGERAARDAAGKTQEHLLLHGHGDEFEFQLLLSQAEAMNYGAQLARVAADNEPEADRRNVFAQLSNQLVQLHEQVLAMLRQPHESSPK